MSKLTVESISIEQAAERLKNLYVGKEKQFAQDLEAASKQAQIRLNSHQNEENSVKVPKRKM